MVKFHFLKLVKKPPFQPTKGLNLIGPAVRRIRTSKRPKVTLDDLSARLEISGVSLSRSILSRIENQQRSVFDYEVIAISHALGVPLEVLYS